MSNSGLGRVNEVLIDLEPPNNPILTTVKNKNEYSERNAESPCSIDQYSNSYSNHPSLLDTPVYSCDGNSTVRMDTPECSDNFEHAMDKDCISGGIIIAPENEVYSSQPTAPDIEMVDPVDQMSRNEEKWDMSANEDLDSEGNTSDNEVEDETEKHENDFETASNCGGKNLNPNKSMNNKRGKVGGGGNNRGRGGGGNNRGRGGGRGNNRGRGGGGNNRGGGGGNNRGGGGGNNRGKGGNSKGGGNNRGGGNKKNKEIGSTDLGPVVVIPSDQCNDNPKDDETDNESDNDEQNEDSESNEENDCNEQGDDEADEIVVVSTGGNNSGKQNNKNKKNNKRGGGGNNNNNNGNNNNNNNNNNQNNKKCNKNNKDNNDLSFDVLSRFIRSVSYAVGVFRKNKGPGFTLESGCLKFQYRFMLTFFYLAYICVMKNIFINSPINCVEHFNAEKNVSAWYNNVCLSYSFIEIGSRRQYLLFYKWVPYYLLAAAGSCYIVRYYMKKLENPRLANLWKITWDCRENFRAEKWSRVIDDVVYYITSKQSSTTYHYFNFLATHVFSAAVDLGILYFTNFVLQGCYMDLWYSSYPFIRDPRNFSDPLSRSFPPFVQCELTPLTQIVGGRTSVLGCHLHLMELYEKIFLLIWVNLIFHWFWSLAYIGWLIIGLTPFAGRFFFAVTCGIVSPRPSYRWAYNVLRNCSLGDVYVLYLVKKWMSPVHFDEIMKKLHEKQQEVIEEKQKELFEKRSKKYQAAKHTVLDFYNSPGANKSEDMNNYHDHDPMNQLNPRFLDYLGHHKRNPNALDIDPPYKPGYEFPNSEVFQRKTPGNKKDKW